MPTATTTAPSYQKLKTLILVLFFLSGITGLTYEILWTRFLVKIVGGAPFAISIVLTIFMGGLGLGGYMAGRIIDRIEKPITLVRLYGALELIIGGFALIIPLLLIAFKPVYAYLYNILFDYFLFFNFLTFIGCAIILAIPVICMGATLPILCRFYVARLSTLGTHAGRLYGLNTIGAAFGSLLCGFWLLNHLGNYGTMFLAVSINILIGLTCFLVRYKETTKSGKYKPSLPEPATAGHPVVTTGQSVANGALVIFAVSGFTSMACEVIWVKLLGIIVGPTTYSFTIVLVTFISGLALGSIFFGWLGDRLGKPMQVLIITQIAAALLILLISQLLGNSQLFFAKLISVYQPNFTSMNLSKAAVLFCLMILPTLCLGATFPLVGKIYTQSLARVGKSIGLAYAINTIGAVLGSFCAGFILIPLVGKETGIRIVIGLQMLTAFAVTIMAMAKGRYLNKKWSLVTAPVALGMVLVFLYPSWDRQLLAMGIYHRSPLLASELNNYGWLETFLNGPDILSKYEQAELVYYGDGAGGIITVLKKTDAMGQDVFMMINSGKVDASSRGDMKTQALLAHFPMLFHPQAKDIMVLGLASGVTTGEILNYPVDRLDILEISREVVVGSDYFRPWNNNSLTDPRSHLIIQDGRAHLALTDQKYDVIVSEPSNPWMAGMATLFTREFFELAREALRDDGIFVQFSHSYQMDWPTFSLIGRTFASVFPNSILIDTDPFASGSDFLLVGIKGDNHLNLENALHNIQYLQKSGNIALGDPSILYRQVRSEDFDLLFGEGPLNTDNFPILEFAAPRAMYQFDPQIYTNLQTRRRLRPVTDSIATVVSTDIDAQIDFAEYALSLFMNSRGMVDLSHADQTQMNRYAELLDKNCSEKLIGLSLIEDPDLRDNCRDLQIASILDNLDENPDKSAAFFHLGYIYSEEAEYDSAVIYYQKGLEVDSNSAGGHYNLAKAYDNLGALSEAAEQFRLALNIRPYWAEANAAYGNLMVRSGLFSEAAQYLSEAIRLDPEIIESYVNLGLAYIQVNDPAQAEIILKKGLDLRPDFPQAHYIYGKLLVQMNRLDEAIIQYSMAVQLQPEFARAHYDLGVVYSQQKNWEKAAACIRNSLALDRDQIGAHYNLGVALVNINSLDSAIYHFNEALRLNPKFAPAREGLALITQMKSGK